MVGLRHNHMIPYWANTHQDILRSASVYAAPMNQPFHIHCWHSPFHWPSLCCSGCCHCRCPFLERQDKQKRAEKEESHGNVFNVRWQKFMHVLAFFIFCTHTEWRMHHSGGCTVGSLPELKPQERHITDMRQRGKELVAIMLTLQFWMIPSWVVLVLAVHCVTFQVGHYKT